MIIKDKKLGLKIADRETAFWIEIKENTERDIERLEKLLKFQNAILVLSKNKISENERK